MSDDDFARSPEQALHDVENDHYYRTRVCKDWHWPKLYRYVVADKGFRVMLNRYPHHVIGAGVVVGRFVYCVKWASLGRRTP